MGVRWFIDSKLKSCRQIFVHPLLNDYILRITLGVVQVFFDKIKWMHSWMHKRLPTYLLSKQKCTCILNKYIHIFFLFLLDRYNMLFFAKVNCNPGPKSRKSSRSSNLFFDALAYVATQTTRLRQLGTTFLARK